MAFDGQYEDADVEKDSTGGGWPERTRCFVPLRWRPPPRQTRACVNAAWPPRGPLCPFSHLASFPTWPT